MWKSLWRTAGKEQKMATVITQKPTIGEWIRAARLVAGLSQGQLEHVTGIEVTRQSAYENGRARPSLTTIERIAEATRADLPWRRDRHPLPDHTTERIADL
jgi:transcriptional regulator with XRE-family HTH domain